MDHQKPVLVIGGPTASGKSAQALKAAKDHDGIIINADSMQIYDALPLLTARPSAEEQGQAPHRLYAVLSPEKQMTAALWRDMALTEIKSAHQENKLPVIVGGTGLYIKTLVKGIAPVPAIPTDIQETAIEEQKKRGNPGFHEALAQKDSAMAARLHPNDTQRLIRAWAVWEATGQSLSYWQSLPPDNTAEDLEFTMQILAPDREELYTRCNERFEQMMEKGALDEVRAFDERIQSGEIPDTAPVTHALGFRPLQAFLHGDISLDEAREQAQTETRHYAKRQMTWFRHQM